jgi:hypothetical protein
MKARTCPAGERGNAGRAGGNEAGRGTALPFRGIKSFILNARGLLPAGSARPQRRG